MTRIRYSLIFPERVQRSSFPCQSSGAFSSTLTRNIVFGNACVTVPSTSIFSLLVGILSRRVILSQTRLLPQMFVSFPFLCSFDLLCNDQRASFSNHDCFFKQPGHTCVGCGQRPTVILQCQFMASHGIDNFKRPGLSGLQERGTF